MKLQGCMLAVLTVSTTELSQDSWVWLCISLAAGGLSMLAQHHCSAQHGWKQQQHLLWHHPNCLPSKPQPRAPLFDRAPLWCSFPHYHFFSVSMAPLHCLTSHPSLQDKTQTKISPCSYIIKKSFSPQTRTSLALKLACSQWKMGLILL